MVPPLESEVLEMIKKNHCSQVSIKPASSLKSIQYSNAIELFFLFKFPWLGENFNFGNSNDFSGISRQKIKKLLHCLDKQRKKIYYFMYNI